MDFVDLFELQKLIRVGLEESFPQSLWVKAEIAQIQLRSNGHCYMDLSQSDERGLVAKAKAVIWKSRYGVIDRTFHSATGTSMQAGMTILALVQVSYSELYGLSLVIDDVEPQFTLGEAELEKQRTIARLAEDGMMQRQKELALPALPYSLAVISAPDAAGYQDFCRHLSGNEYGFVFDVQFFEATMQGQNAPQSISDAISLIENSDRHYDALLIMRGGGSALDLACFDDYSLCAAIASCSIPVFTAIGHDRDYHVADMVANGFVKTPTALADLFIDAFAAEDERISAFATSLRLRFAERLARMESAVDLLESSIKASDPRTVLSRGYTLITDEKGVVLKSSGSLKEGDKIRILFEDGIIDARIL